MFPCLKTFSIRQDDLIGQYADDEDEEDVKLIDILPRSLEVLELTGCNEKIFRRLAELAVVRRERLHKLKNINIIMEMGRPRGEHEEELRMVMEAFGEDEEVVTVFRQWDDRTGLYTKW
jgi:hypothetical protein